MSSWLVALEVLGGFLLLLGGGDVLVRGASGLALRLKVAPALIGLTVVAAGTSMPELFVSLSAAWRGSSDVAVGNVVGSNFYNIALILGLCAVMHPLKVLTDTLRFEAPIMVLAALLIPVMAQDLLLDRWEGGFLVAAQITFLMWVIRQAKKGATPEERQEWEEEIPAHPPDLLRSGLEIAGGLGMLVLGSHWFVDGSVTVAQWAGISERVIGLTMVAIGTSLPELVTSVVSTLRGRDDIAIGNVVGSNIFNVLTILGVTSVILPVPVNPAIVASDAMWMVGVSLLLVPMMWTGSRLSRGEGVVLLGASGVYSWMLLT